MGKFTITGIRKGDPPLWDSNHCPRSAVTPFSAFAFEQFHWIEMGALSAAEMPLKLMRAFRVVEARLAENREELQERAMAKAKARK